MSDTSTIMGFIPKNKYVLYTYYLLLGAAIGRLVLHILAMGGIFVPLDAVVMLAALAGIVLALLGFFVFKEDFTPLDQSHLMYVIILFGVFFVVGFIVNNSIYTLTAGGMIVSVLLGLAQILLLFTGFNSWKHGRSITKDNIRTEVRAALQKQ